jgi:hypothetical protein
MFRFIRHSDIIDVSMMVIWRLWSSGLWHRVVFLSVSTNKIAECHSSGDQNIKMYPIVTPQYSILLTHNSVVMMCNRTTAMHPFKFNSLLLLELSPSGRAANSADTSQHFMEPEGSLPCSQESSTGPYHEQRIPTAVNLGFLDRSRYFLEIAPQLYPRGWVDPVPDPLLLRKSGSARNWTRSLWIASQELWPLDHRGGRFS